MPSAFALDSVLIEIVFVVGPLITTVVVATIGPQYALMVSAGCVVAGTLLLLSGLTGHPGPEPSHDGRRAYGLGALADPGLRTLVFASLPVGFALGSVEVALPAFSDAEGSKALAGVLLAVWSGASGVAGLTWAPRVALRAARRPPAVRVAAAGGHRAARARLLSGDDALLVVLAGIADCAADRVRNQLVERAHPVGTATAGLHVAAHGPGRRRLARSGGRGRGSSSRAPGRRRCWSAVAVATIGAAARGAPAAQTLAQP